MMNGMVTMLDQGVKNVTEALKQTGMWDNTLIVFSAGRG
jgi:arylsulfatase B/arylsulfatase I/J